MNPTALLPAALLTATAVCQGPVTCTAPLPGSTLATASPFVATHYQPAPVPPPPAYNGAGILCDVTAVGPTEIRQLDLNLYDDGVINPNQLNNQTTVNVWVVPGTWVGNETTAAAWTLAGTGTLTVSATNQPSVVVFGTPALLPTGASGVAIQIQAPTAGANIGPLHPLVVVPSWMPSMPLQVSDAWLALGNFATTGDLFTNAVNTPLGVSCAFHHAPSVDYGYTLTYGTGCYRQSVGFHEHFPGPVPVFDLGGLALQLTPGTGMDYAVAGIPAAIVAPTTPALANQASLPLGNDDLTAPQTLPFTFPFRGTPGITQITIASNGFVWLDGTSTGATPFADDVPGLLQGPARLCPAWGDWDPSAGGSVHFEANATNDRAYVTWLGIPELNQPGSTLTAQLVLHDTGIVEFHYGIVTPAAAPLLVGYSPGNGVRDPGSRDLADNGNVLAFTSGDNQPPPFLDLDARPVLGTTPNLVTTHIPPSAMFNLVMIGFGSIADPGFDLGVFGMPGCAQWILPVVTNGAAVLNGSSSTPLVLPLDPIYLGANLFAQSAPLAPGFNPTGILVSNGVCIRAGY